MGTNKAFVKVGGKPIIERIIERVQGLGDETVIIANTPDRYRHLGLPIHGDLIPGKASLGGLYTAIASTQGHHTLVLSCDHPFLNSDLLRYLIGLREGYDVVVPLNAEGYPQSLHALYSKACLDPIRKRLDTHQLKIIGFFPDVRVREVTISEIERFDPEHLSFVNINRPDDLAQAQRLAARRG
jgi:molybdopterin-guanine dinucleotide biosynthesis protein A